MKTTSLLSLILGLVLCGCTQGSARPVPETPTALRPLLETPTAAAASRQPLGASGNERYGSFTIPAGSMPEVLRNATPEEAPVVADGIITFSEYEQLAFERMACWEQGGLTVVHSVGFGRTDGFQPGPLLTMRGEYVFSASGKPGQTWAEGREVYDRCGGKYPQVEFFWLAIQTEPSETERQKHRDAIARCLRDGGHEAPEHPSAQELKVIAFPPDGVGSIAIEPDWFRTCHWAANDEYQIQGVF